MAFCTKGMVTIKNLWHKITPALEAICDKILAITDIFRKLEAEPVIEDVLKLIPGEPAIQAAFDTGVNALTDVDGILKETNVATKVQMFLADIQKYDPKAKNALLFKLASLIVGALDGNQHAESDYDSIVQLKVMINKAEAVA